MDLVLMTTSAPRNALDKDPATVATLSGTLKEDSSVLDPVITVESAGKPGGNYAYISDFGRYYYIHDIVNVYNNFWEVHLHVDVLYTYRTAILNAPCIITKTASRKFNLYLPDPNFKCQQNDIVGMWEFPNGFDSITPKFYMTFFG